MKNWMIIIGAASLLAACGDGGGKTGSETHWLQCDTTMDCNSDFVCVSGRCLPEDEVGNNQSTNGSTNNQSTNGSTNNQSTNGSTNNGTNNSTGDVCPATGAPVPAELPAVHEVRLQIESEYPNPVWITTQGWYCTPFSVGSLPLEIGFRCGCECPNPGSARPSVMQQVMPNETFEVVWDGRQAVTYTECMECGPEPLFETAAVKQPAPAGTYDIVVPFVLDLPSHCNDNGDGTANCDSDPMTGQDAFAEIAPRCDLDFTFVGAASVTLPGPNETPDVIDVTVVLPVGP